MKKGKFIKIGLFMFLLLLSMNAQAAGVKQPKLKKITSISYNKLQVEWTPINNCSGYEIYRKSGKSNYKRIAVVSKWKTNKYVDKKISEGTRYTYTVKAFKKSKGKILKSSYNKKGIKGVAVLTKPSGIQVINGKDKKLTVSWKKVKDASGYEVYRAKSKNGKYKKIKTLKGKNKVSYEDAKLTNGKTYYYKIRSYKSIKKKKVYSKFSKVKSNIVTIKEDIEKNNSRIQKATTFKKFSQKAKDIILENTNLENIPDNAGEFYFKRLIVKGKTGNIDFTAYNPKTILFGYDNLYVLQFVSELDTRKAFQQIKNMSGIEYVESDKVCKGETVSPAKAYKARSWGANKIGTTQYANYIEDKISGRVTVAVVDSGVDSDHPMLAGRLLPNGNDFVDNDKTPEDEHGHGTHVAGTVADCTSGLPVKILPIRVLNQNNRGSVLGIGLGILDAVNNGADIINLSLSGTEKGNFPFWDQSIEYALKNNVIVVAAAGNKGSDTAMYCPSHLDDIIVVGAVDQNDQKADFSNIGNSVDVVAPGVGIVSCAPGGGYVSMGGTSMAAPHVSAIAAMFKLRYPSYSPKKIENLIKENTKDLGSLGWDKYYGYGIPDLKRLVPVEVAEIKINTSQISLYLGDSQQLNAMIIPENASDKTVQWSSSNSNVAIVSKGRVTAKSSGTTVISAKTKNGKMASCICTVREKPVIVEPQKITFSSDYYFIGIGEKRRIVPTITPSNTTDKTLKWDSNTTSIVSVDNTGIMTGKAKGTTIVTAETINGRMAMCQVWVGYNHPTAPLVRKSGNSFYNVTNEGNKNYVSVNRMDDLYIKVPLDRELSLDSVMTIAVDDGTSISFSETKIDPTEYIVDRSWCYYPIKSAIFDKKGEIRVYYELKLANGTIIHPQTWGNIIFTSSDAYFLILK